MRKQRGFVVLALAIFFALAPVVAAAQGLVPCAGVACQACDLVDLIQNVINFLLGLSIPLAIGLFAWAGILHFTAAANEGNITKARGIFRDALYGFLIALGAYLIVETVLHAVLSRDYWTGWNQIKCSTEERPMDKSVADLFGEALNNLTGTGGSTDSGNLQAITAFNCKNLESCKVSQTVNLKLEQMKGALGDKAGQYQITETGLNTTVNHASGANNLDMSCFGVCSPSQVQAAIQTWPGTVKYETNTQTDYNTKLNAGVPAANMLLLTGTFSNGVCSAGPGKCITAPHMSLKP